MVVLRSVKRALIHLTENHSTLFIIHILDHIKNIAYRYGHLIMPKNILMLEKVQSRAAKLVLGLQEFTYEERLTQLKLYRLEERGLRRDLI